MKFFPKGGRSYAILLILLFSIAAVATKSVVDLATDRLYLSGYESAGREISLAIWLLTMGFMFLAGALGLLAISATAEYESRYRIVKIVDAMHYLSDGLLALDYQGRVRGANPAMRRLMTGQLDKKTTVSAIFPFLKEDDIKCLLSKASPCEIETEFSLNSGLRVWRLRSQPVEGLTLVLVSDITEKHSANIRQQQTAKLQLLGRIASGVAHDFSNILSAISGHAVLMQRFSADQHSHDDAIRVILGETQRGVRLSRQLLALSRSSDFDGQVCVSLVESVHEAEELLRVALSSAWQLELDVQGVFPVVPLSSVQIVQIVLNLGLLAADALKKPGKLAIHMQQPDNFSQDARHPGERGGESAMAQRGAGIAAIITILAAAKPESAPADLPSPPGLSAIVPAKVAADSLLRHSATQGRVAQALQDDSGRLIAPELQSTAMGMVDTTGVIPSVVRALIEEAGGRLDELYTSSARSLYRICLPAASKLVRSNLIALKSVIKGPFLLKQWRILLAFSDGKLAWLGQTLAALGAIVETKTAIDAVLNAVDAGRKPDVIIADKNLFGDDANSFLKVMRKICPHSGIIVLSRAPEKEELRQERGFVFISSDGGEEAWIDAIVASRQAVMPQK